MSAMERLEDAAKTNKDDETPVPSTASDNKDAESGDTTTAIVEDIPQTVLQMQTSSNAKSKLQTTDEPNLDLTPDKKYELCSDYSGTLASHDTDKTGEVCDENEITVKNAIKPVVTETGNVSEEVTLSTGPSNSKNDEGIENKAKPVTDTTGYRETVLDDISDSELELHWTDDDDDDLLSQTLIDEELIRQNKKIEIVDAGKDNDPSHENILKHPSQGTELTNKNIENIMNQDIEMTDETAQKAIDIDDEMTDINAHQIIETSDANIPKVIDQNVQKIDEKVQKVKGEDVEIIENIRSESDITEADFQPSIDGALKLLDDELGTDDCESLVNKGSDKIVEQPEQLKDQADDTVQNNLEAAVAVEEQTTLIVCQSKAINVTIQQDIEDTQLMNLGSPSETNVKPTDTEIDIISLEVEPESMPDVKEEIVTEDTKPIPMIQVVSSISIGSDDQSMNKRNSEIVVKTAEKSDTVPQVVEFPIKKEGFTEPMTMPESVSGRNISIESNDQKVDGSNTENVAKTVKNTGTVPTHTSTLVPNNEVEDITEPILASNKVDDSNITKKSNDSIVDKNVTEDIVNIIEPMPKRGNDSNSTKDPIDEEKHYAFVTLDDTNDSISTNTDHRINRPIEETDLNLEFDKTSGTDKQESSDIIDKDDRTNAATVTNIVTPAKDVLVEKNSDSNKLTDESKTESILDTTQVKTESDKMTVETPEKMISEAIDKDDNKILTEVADKTFKKAETALETNESVPSPQEDTELKRSTSDVAKSSDSTEEMPNVIDSLGLLTVSSRVMEDDEDDDQMEPDEEDDDGADDDDDDFDPDAEDSSNHTAEQSEESNPPHSEVDIHEEVPLDIVEADVSGLADVSDSNDIDDAFQSLLDDTAIKMEENEQLMDIGQTVIQENVAKQDEETVSKDVEKAAEASEEAKEASTAKRDSILSKLLMKIDDEKSEAAISTKPQDKLRKLQISSLKNVLNYVDLGESSDDDAQEKEELQKAPSSAIPLQLDNSDPSKRKSTDNETTEVATEKESTNVVKDKPKVGEVFNLDSDDDDKAGILGINLGAIPVTNPCVNHNCTSDGSVPQYLADRMTLAFYGAARRSGRAVCENCLDIVNSRNQGLVSGIKDLRPLFSLRMARPTQQLLEISDSDSEGEDDPVGEAGAKILEEQLTDIMNETWTKYGMDDRLKDTENFLEAELAKMKKQSDQIDLLLKNCQKATDKLRVDFYTGFDPKRKELPALSVVDTPTASYACFENEEETNTGTQASARYPKRRSTTTIDTPTKKQALVVKKMTRSSSGMVNQKKLDEDKDVSVVRLSAEAAPAELPPPGEYVRAALQVGAEVYAMKNHYGAWLRARVLELLPSTADNFTQCRVRFEHKVVNPIKQLTGRAVAYTEPCNVRMTIGTRVIALSKNSENANKRGSFFYSGVIAEIPTPVNRFRYLVFFDDGYVQYVAHQHTRLVYEYNAMVWEEVHPYSRDFVCNYLQKYPERPMVRMHKGQALVVELNGQWTKSTVVEVDAAVVKVLFPTGREEWLYRGSTRLQPLFSEFEAAKGGTRARLPRTTKAGNQMSNMPYVEYTRSDGELQKNDERDSDELRLQRSVAKKSTSLPPPLGLTFAAGGNETLVSRVVFYTPKNTVRPQKLVPHTCGPKCNRSDLIPLEELRTYNPLSKPLLSGWERQIVRHRYFRDIMYRAPCGRRLRNMAELHHYLSAVQSEMSVDLFDFGLNTHCLAEFLLNHSAAHKKDISLGVENVPVPCVNFYSNVLPDVCMYSTERTPTAGVPLNLDPEFLCGCDCEDDCADKTKCSCWKMTIEGARTIGMEGNVGYEYRRLLEPVSSGIYECNVRCKCKSTCLNRVVQIPLQLKLQVFKTLNRGWGIRSLNDVPKGSFLCIYAGNLLTDATANLDGLNEGDEYLAELDYIEVVEAMKEGYEDDIPEKDKKLDKKAKKKTESSSESESTESEEEQAPDKNDKEDGDFQPGYLSLGLTEFNKRLRRRNKKKDEAKVKKEEAEEKAAKKGEDEECITISDDEEVRVSQREPTRLTAQEGMIDNKVVPKYRSIRSYFGKDEACYIMDAKVKGNIGRYLNHSCSPNVFVQNVFVDTHDPRFPWVSFFALHHIRSGTELTWNYNYDVGSVPGKVLYCFCGAPNCRGRLL